MEQTLRQGRRQRRQFLVSTIGRRRFLQVSGLGVLSALLGQVPRVQAHADRLLQHHMGPWRTTQLGTTFSPLQCRYMDLVPRRVFDQVCRLELDRIRLGAYWNAIEKRPGEYDFAELDWLLDRCDAHGIEAVLAVGMKVPRWPEFHFPDWVAELGDIQAGTEALDVRSPAVAAAALKFVERVIEHCRSAPALQYIQVENEPFTRLEITGGRFLSPAFVQREVELVRSGKRRHQKILLTNALHLPSPKLEEDHSAFWNSLPLGDAVGMNVYTKVPAGDTGFYLEPATDFWQTLQTWQQTLQQYDREAWIAEAQAEPWEPQQLVAMKNLDNPSATPLRMRTLVHALRGMGYSTILLWGCEYWYWQRQQGRNQWWWEVQRLLAEARSANLTLPLLPHGTPEFFE